MRDKNKKTAYGAKIELLLTELQEMAKTNPGTEHCPVCAPCCEQLVVRVCVVDSVHDARLGKRPSMLVCLCEKCIECVFACS